MLPSVTHSMLCDLWIHRMEICVQCSLQTPSWAQAASFLHMGTRQSLHGGAGPGGWACYWHQHPIGEEFLRKTLIETLGLLPQATHKQDSSHHQPIWTAASPSTWRQRYTWYMENKLSLLCAQVRPFTNNVTCRCPSYRGAGWPDSWSTKQDSALWSKALQHLATQATTLPELLIHSPTRDTCHRPPSQLRNFQVVVPDTLSLLSSQQFLVDQGAYAGNIRGAQWAFSWI
jgi:hypothetical protein